jgi:endogenous inhibitor of DNA gyrase (YacG/DUF329 family)
MPGKQDEIKPTGKEQCRYCHRRLSAADSEHKRFWPFCSDRCKMAELGLWFSDRYVISRTIDDVTDDAALKGHKKGSAPAPSGD